MKTKMLIGSIVIVLALIFAGCQGGSQMPELDGTAWELVEMDGEQPISNAGKTPTISFSERQASGNAGCNYWGTAYTTKGDALSFDEVETSAMLCESPPGLMKQEEAFIQMLGEAERFELQDSKLTIFTSGGPVFVFEEMGT